MERQDLIFRVFVSSTFSDLVAERNVLQKKAFPALREYCRRRGARFQAIDLRWGVSQEAALDQQTMNICRRELKQCQTLSPQPNFIVLLGDRYGWRPLPPQIEASEFEEILAQVPKLDKALLTSDADVPPWRDGEHTERTGWYRKDRNAVPETYVLQPRRIEFPQEASPKDRKRIGDAEYQDWEVLQERMRFIFLQAIEKLGWPSGDPRRFKYEASATHQEIRAGALEAENPETHVFCYFRHIKDLPQDERAAKYRDIRDHAVDGDAGEDLARLKQQLGDLLPDEHVHSAETTWKEPQPKAYLDALCTQVEEDLRGVIDSELEAFEHQPELAREREAHREFGAERARHFIGRSDALEKIRAYIVGSEAKPLVVYGLPGFGKTALLAKAALDLKATGKSTVAARFIGATPGSAEIRSLLTSLCNELGEVYGKTDPPPSDINELVREFGERLALATADRLLVLFVDAVNQLDPGDGLRSLFWIPRELPAHARLVFSVLKDDVERGCCDVAKRMLPEEFQVELGPLSEEHADRLLDAWLAEAGRTLQPAQRSEVLGKFKGCPRPLYLKLAFEEARRWKSWEPAPCLGPDIPGILDDLLNRLEHTEHHGKVLVGRALGYLRAARHGLTEDEVLDVLSADGDVMAHFHSQSPTELEKLPEKRLKDLPVIVWSRLYGDIEANMARRRADGTVVLSFYHDQVRETVERRYLAGEERLRAHLQLAEYFAKQDYWAESPEAQQARARRLPPTPRPANVRKVVELPYHRLEAAKLGGKDDPKSKYWDDVADLLTDWQFLEAKAEADPDFREQEAQEPSATSNEAKA